MGPRPLTCVGKWGLRVSLDISLGKLEHEAVNLLRFSGKTECLQERAESTNEPDVTEVDHVNKGMHRCDVDLVTDGDQRYE
jgi:hypothetical protein